MKKLEKEIKDLSPIEIGFGYEFLDTHESLPHVIIDVGSGRVCEGTFVMNINRKEALNVGKFGTIVRSDIQAITGIWTYERVINAVMNYLDEKEPKGKLYEVIRRYSQNKPRMLTM